MARLVFTLEDGTEIETELDAEVISIGRHPECSIVLPSPSVSAHHATIKHRGDSYYLHGLNATNGTKLNGVEVEEAKLEDGDQLYFGAVPAIVHLNDGSTRKPGDFELAEKFKPSPPRVEAPLGIAAQRQSSGDAGLVILLIFLISAFLTGMCLRHYQENGGFLLKDMVERFQEKAGDK